MKNMLVRSVVVPVVTRLGTALGAYLVAKGLDGDLADQLVNGLIAIFLVGCDLIAGRYVSHSKEAA
ncbi:hypothetical protein [Mesorhizobium shangrilense]|uniref:EAL domain-containing protein n=1 Tax=Mesorhizobium shangrilense TaxID=460060 RepID=A0ABV2DNB9_9HYPH